LEQEFLKKIEEGFPNLETLYILGAKLGDDQEKPITITSSRIIFPRLIYLNLEFAYLDNIEQVLSDDFIYLPRLREVHVEYEKLAALTDNFTNDVARVNCSKVQVVDLHECFVPPENFFSYFPSLDILKK
jgi:hypothetical protein